ncbi:hypothetical protein TrLO_g3889 [Triparma laevis f. longispina]|uniref:WW domain-containing protein n=1 Tax=Triparma laevis f. longispina TaxID=1714387 RepID=A0A9W7AK80_9STRA|nr:hypothetical protein TrLO_g3889 [Triparma laevis f. longispina]
MCPPGQFSGVASPACAKCEPGKYADGKGISECTKKGEKWSNFLDYSSAIVERRYSTGHGAIEEARAVFVVNWSFERVKSWVDFAVAFEGQTELTPNPQDFLEDAPIGPPGTPPPSTRPPTIQEDEGEKTAAKSVCQWTEEWDKEFQAVYYLHVDGVTSTWDTPDDFWRSE